MHAKGWRRVGNRHRHRDREVLHDIYKINTPTDAYIEANGLQARQG